LSEEEQAKLLASTTVIETAVRALVTRIDAIGSGREDGRRDAQ
jgi:hypothetical protein